MIIIKSYCQSEPGNSNVMGQVQAWFSLSGFTRAQRYFRPCRRSLISDPVSWLVLCCVLGMVGTQNRLVMLPVGWEVKCEQKSLQCKADVRQAPQMQVVGLGQHKGESPLWLWKFCCLLTVQSWAHHVTSELCPLQLQDDGNAEYEVAGKNKWNDVEKHVAQCSSGWGCCD